MIVSLHENVYPQFIELKEIGDKLMADYTIKDVARLANVSIATVSRVLNGTKRANPETREKVMSAVELTGYRPNALARGLVNKRTHAIGVMIPEISNEIFAQVINGLESILDAKGYSIFLAITNGNEEKELKYFQSFEDKKIDGIILSGVKYSSNHKQFFSNKKIPAVVIGQQFQLQGFPNINIDNIGGAHMATTHLLDNGHTKIGFISAPLYDLAVGVDRLKGFKQAMKDRQISVSKQSVVYADSFKISSGYEAAKTMLAHTYKPTAIFAATDRLALGAMNYLHDHGLKIPQDCSIIGFDDVEISSLVRPKLTTVHVNYSEYGTQAANLLLELLENDTRHLKTNIVFPTTLALRDSVITNTIM
jgi:LacI family transcriptional regulator